MADWHQGQQKGSQFDTVEKDDEHPHKYYRGDYCYWLDLSESETDKVFYYGQLYATY